MHTSERSPAHLPVMLGQESVTSPIFCFDKPSAKTGSQKPDIICLRYSFISKKGITKR